jgi:hypothetical protein
MSFDLSKANDTYIAKIPAEGKHPAIITDVQPLTTKDGDASLLKVTYRTEADHTLETFSTIDAEQGSSRLKEIPEGVAFVKSLCAATNTDMSTLTDEDQIINAFLGEHVQILVLHRKRKNFPEPFVKAVQPLSLGDQAAVNKDPTNADV